MKKIYPIACGLTSNNRPNITFQIPDFNNNLTFTLWYRTTFYKKGDALEFLKEVFELGIENDDIGLWWLKLSDIKNEDI